MTTWPEKIFYSLSTVALTAAIFAMSPSYNSNVTAFQDQVKHEFTIAAIQVFGDQPVFDEALLVIESINEFYVRSADTMIVLLTPAHGEQDQLNQLAAEVYEGLRTAFNTTRHLAVGSSPQVLGSETVNEDEGMEYNMRIPENFMQEEPIYNIVPESTEVATAEPDKLVYSITEIESDVDLTLSTPTWVDMKDGVTGQIYCVAIFNAEVNRYIGPCKSDYK